MLATRERGRGLASSAYDVWMPNLAPSTALLKWFLRERDAGRVAKAWPRFAREYREQMLQSPPLDEDNRIKNRGQKYTLRLLGELSKRQNVTLLCHCPETTEHCHRFLLEQLIRKHAGIR